MPTYNVGWLWWRLVELTLYREQKGPCEVSFSRPRAPILGYFWGSGMVWDAQGMKGYP